jgi:hypothetical protein
MTDKSVHATVVFTNTMVFSFAELCHECQLEEHLVLEFIELDIIHADSGNNSFSYRQFQLVEKAIRLKRDLELNNQGVAVVIELLDRISEQERELALLRYQLGTSE